ncbi:uncharacterized protein BJ212DRAFT_1480870 [Suillus subaureus]|uniref:DUF6532 domain-containing protein n=1 Tax=Suillus subaureus TaxID=48587 RepID=A0A9P7EBA9_9AGAM|nr:uncharacterized protein BJ212DRAFT_1480870 [Suillus subaureus]KAG1816421.1 hypothetical protein BJ212DRAFT_1480870 [Suillus subaureus]
MKDSVPVVSADDASSEDSGDGSDNSYDCNDERPHSKLFLSDDDSIGDEEVEDTSQHQLEVSDEDIKLNIKALHGRCQCLKAADFDHITKDVLATATSIYRCLVVTQAPFPETLLVETMLAKCAWHEASDITGLTVQLTPSLVKMMMRRTSHVRGELKTKMRGLTSSFFGFWASWSMTAIKANRDLAESLKEGISFVFKDWEMKTGIYKMELIQKAINDMWFTNCSDKGILYAKYFDPLPLKLMALALMVMECCINEWATGVREDIKFSLVSYSPVYLAHLNSLERFEQCTAPYKLLEKIRDNLLDVAHLHAGGIDPSKTAVSVDALTNDVFDDAIREYEVKMQAARNGRPQGVEASDA